MSLNILPECHADTLMINILGYKRVNHCNSKGDVAKVMIKDFHNKKAVGVVDKDKASKITPNYFKQFEVIQSYSGFEVQHLKNTAHYLIVVDPVLEHFLLNLARELDIPTAKYGFHDLKSLLRITKNKHVAKNQKFKNFLNSLSQKKGSPLIQMKAEIERLLQL